MKLSELQQVKQDLANGIIISRSQWVKVLNAAIASKLPAVVQMTDEQIDKLWSDILATDPLPQPAYRALARAAILSASGVQQ